MAFSFSVLPFRCNKQKQTCIMHAVPCMFIFVFSVARSGACYCPRKGVALTRRLTWLLAMCILRSIRNPGLNAIPFLWRYNVYTMPRQ